MPRHGSSMTAARCLRRSARNARSAERRRRTPTRNWCRYSGFRPIAAPAALAPICSSAASVSAMKATPALERSGSAGLRHLRGPCTGYRGVGWPMGLEPTTTGITIQDSTFELRPPLQQTITNSSGLPGGTRTHNPQLRRLVLYPVELRAVALHPPSQPGADLVGVERFELPTSSSQSWRATRLRYTPKIGRQ